MDTTKDVGGCRSETCIKTESLGSKKSDVPKITDGQDSHVSSEQLGNSHQGVLSNPGKTTVLLVKEAVNKLDTTADTWKPGSFLAQETAKRRPLVRFPGFLPAARSPLVYEDIPSVDWDSEADEIIEEMILERPPPRPRVPPVHRFGQGTSVSSSQESNDETPKTRPNLHGKEQKGHKGSDSKGCDRDRKSAENTSPSWKSDVKFNNDSDEKVSGTEERYDPPADSPVYELVYEELDGLDMFESDGATDSEMSDPRTPYGIELDTISALDQYSATSCSFTDSFPPGIKDFLKASRGQMKEDDNPDLKRINEPIPRPESQTPTKRKRNSRLGRFFRRLLELTCPFCFKRGDNYASE